MKKSDFFYNLPTELIAQHPVRPRDSSKLLHYIKEEDKLQDTVFFDIVNYLKKGDVLVLNNTKVIPARLFGHRKGKEESIEILLNKRINKDEWECIGRPAKKLKIGTVICFSDKLSCIIEEILDDGLRKIRFIFEGIFEEILDEIGNMPLPPYITDKLKDNDDYQTIYSKEKGSAAAPTAGLHFTSELLDKIREKGVEIVEILLHVGLGTFRPVKEEDVLKHKMHSEYYKITKGDAEVINNAILEKRRVIAVGTTSVRALESAVNEKGLIEEKEESTSIFIYPPYKFKVVDAIITNFHLPESTLIMLIAAFIGREKTLELYKYAVDKKYRFFSFGDAMFLE